MWLRDLKLFVLENQECQISLTHLIYIVVPNNNDLIYVLMTIYFLLLLLLSATKIYLLRYARRWHNNRKYIIQQFMFQDSVIGCSWCQRWGCIYFYEPRFQLSVNYDVISVALKAMSVRSYDRRYSFKGVYYEPVNLVKKAFCHLLASCTFQIHT